MAKKVYLAVDLGAETPMTDRDIGMNISFNRLFKFITGGIELKQKIAMTTPVFMTSSDTSATMAFVLPTKFKAEAVPQPADSNVKVGSCRQVGSR